MHQVARLLVLLLALPLAACSASTAGQLSAASMEPLVQSVTGDLETYLDAGLASDGSALTAEAELRMRGGIVILRNAVHTALGREREPLPALALPEDDGDEGDDESASGD